MLYILLASFVVMTASLVGVILLWKSLGDFIEKNLRYLVSLSAGVFLVISFQLTSETLEHSTTIATGLGWIVVGLVGIYGLFKLLPSFHHHHDKSGESHPHSQLDVKRIIIGDAIHNIADGILLVSSFAVNLTLGVITTISIFFHEVIQEMSEFFVMRQSGYSVKKALLVNFAVSSTILIGSLGSFFLLEKFEILEVPLLGISAGVFLLVVFFDLIPHSVRHSEKRIHHITHITCFLVGIALMTTVLALTPHAHSDEENHYSEDLHLESSLDLETTTTNQIN